MERVPEIKDYRVGGSNKTQMGIYIDRGRRGIQMPGLYDRHEHSAHIQENCSSICDCATPVDDEGIAGRRPGQSRNKEAFAVQRYCPGGHPRGGRHADERYSVFVSGMMVRHTHERILGDLSVYSSMTDRAAE